MANFEVDTDSNTDDLATFNRVNNPQIGTEFCQLLQMHSCVFIFPHPRFRFMYSVKNHDV